ncbi:MAG: RlpA-like double-psi beta-barrel domain-containing protein [Thiotrichaceae bacterium]
MNRSDHSANDVNTSACASLSVYKVNGKKYRTLKNIEGYKADGVAVVYNNKAQGSQTTGCESFDMNGFTAAHRTLPLPTHIKITNKNNGKAVVVKVNDRGPATGHNLIQVTPAVASLLEASATFPVHIEAISRANISIPSASSARPTTSVVKKSPTALRPARPVNRSNSDRYYIVVGTYPTKDEAFDRFVRVSSIGLANAAMETRKLKGRTLHMVRIGPFYDQDKIDNAKDRLRNDGLIKFNVVKN